MVHVFFGSFLWRSDRLGWTILGILIFLTGDMPNTPKNRLNSSSPSEDDWGEPIYAQNLRSKLFEQKDQLKVSDTPQGVRPHNTTFIVIAIIAGLIVFGLVIMATVERQNERNKFRPEIEELDRKSGKYE